MMKNPDVIKNWLDLGKSDERFGGVRNSQFVLSFLVRETSFWWKGISCKTYFLLPPSIPFSHFAFAICFSGSIFKMSRFRIKFLLRKFFCQKQLVLFITSLKDFFLTIITKKRGKIFAMAIDNRSKVVTVRNTSFF